MKRADALARLFDAVHQGVFIGTMSSSGGDTVLANPHLKRIFGHAADAASTEVHPFAPARFQDVEARQELIEVERHGTPQTKVDVLLLGDGYTAAECRAAFRTHARRAADAGVTREVLGPPRFITFEGDAGDGRGYILVPDRDAMRDFVTGLIGD